MVKDEYVLLEIFKDIVCYTAFFNDNYLCGISLGFY